ncbi:hypothetical protein [Pseudomonas sp. DP-17]|uniref:hypothetical protein n=1 Tax=Pseudomonas sp. DP-17 TaxID=1580486 RepID=UPI001EFA7516|nr:hypothetical protein [Pseudomonas sp. DP-17]MCG8910325.1 hypothetical protein [Pseudomonas sp. DP-17]
MSLLEVLKLTGQLIPGLLAVVGLYLTLRNSQGKVSKKGIAALALGIFGTIIAVVTQIVESHQQQLEKNAAADRAIQEENRLEGIRHDLSKGMQPLQEFSVALFRARALSRDPDVELYRENLYDSVSAFLKKPREERDADKDFLVADSSLMSSRAVPETVTIKPEGGFYPTPGTIEEVGSKLMPMCFDFVFYKDPLPEEKLNQFAVFGMGVGDVHVRSAFPTHLDLKLDVKRNDLYMDGFLALGDWEDRSGRILAIPDLAGAQLLIATCPRAVPNPPDPRGVRLVSDPFWIDGLRLKFGNRSIVVRSADLVRHADGEYALWEYRFPKNENALNEVLRGI